MLILAGMLLLVVLLAWSAYRWIRREQSERQAFDRNFLIGLGRGVGLDRYSERRYFGEQIQELAGTFKRLEVELEIGGGGKAVPYLRMTLQFPRTLAQDVSLYSGSRRPLGSSVRGLERFEFGEPEFDERFVSYARDADRAERLLNEATRYQLMRMNGIVDDLQLTDYSLFLFVGEPMNREELKAMLKKALELGDRLFRSAETLGPRAPQKREGHYQQATIEQSVRTSSLEDPEWSAGAE